MPLGDIKRSSRREGIGFACVVQLVRAVDRESKDPGSSPSTVESVSFFTERFQIL